VVELSPCWRDFAESTLAEIPAFIVRSAQAITPTIPKNEPSAITLGKLLVLEWIQAKL
jgi:hypothetical protein